MVVLAALLGFAAAVSAAATVPSADMVGLRVAVGDRGVKRAEGIALPYIVKALQDIKIGDLNLDEDGFKFNIKSVECKNLAINSLVLSVSPPAAPMAIGVALGDLTLKCTAGWHYELSIWPHVPYGDGTVSMDVDGNVIAYVTPSTDAAMNNTQIVLNSVTPSISIKNIDFEGGITAKILDLFKDHLSSFIGGEISSQIKSIASSEITSTVNPLLAKMPFALLACSVLAGPKALACELSPKGAVDVPPTVPVVALPEPDAATIANRDVAILVDNTPINEVLEWVYAQAMLLQYTVTPAAVPSSLPIKLDTNSFEGIAPGMAKQYPNESLQIFLNATARPDFEVGQGIVNLSVPVELVWSVCNASVRDCNAVFDGPGLTEAFRLEAAIKVGLTVETSADGSNATLINGSVPFIDATLSLKSSNVGDVNVADLQGLVSFAVQGEALPALNKILNKGVAIPTTIGPVHITALDIAFSAPAAPATAYMSIAADVNYTAPDTFSAVAHDATTHAMMLAAEAAHHVRHHGMLAVASLFGWMHSGRVF